MSDGLNNGTNPIHSPACGDALVDLEEEMKLKQVKVNKDGWSRWEVPKMKGYLMGCCDCGLVHEMEFKVLKRQKKTTRNGYWKAEEMNPEIYRVTMRAKRKE